MAGASLYLDEQGALLYDIAYDHRRDAEANIVEKCLEKYGRPRANLLDLACGGGKFIEEMLSRGWDVQGVDSSAQMIALARQRLGPEVPLLVADICSFDLPRKFSVAACWLDSLTYLLTNEDIIRHLQSVQQALISGGLYFVDLSFSRWADAFWHWKNEGWKPEFKHGWESTRGDTVVYHDGCDGPPLDPLRHLFTEHMYFEVKSRQAEGRREYCYTSFKRALHPQEFAALVSASGAFTLVDWFPAQRGVFDLSCSLETAEGKARTLVVLRRT